MNFHRDNYEHTASLLRSSNEKIVQAALSNNINIIIDALDCAARSAIADLSPPQGDTELPVGPSMTADEAYAEGVRRGIYAPPQSDNGKPSVGAQAEGVALLRRDNAREPDPLPQGDSKPVAWRWEHEWRKDEWTPMYGPDKPLASPHRRNITPLYAHLPKENL